MKKLIPSALIALTIISSCGISNTAGGSLIGAGGGAALGALVGGLISKDAKGAAIGAAVGTAVGAGTGAIIGNKMDKKAKELEALENAKIETVTDKNGLEAIKVTFDSGIFFKTNQSALNATSKKELKSFAEKMADFQDTDISVFGHTDNTGSAAVNEKLSIERAESVAKYLQSCGIAASRISCAGLSFNDPVASNDTEEGRAKNRRVEVFVSANADMIAAAENGTLK